MTRQISDEEWDARIREQKLNKSDMNKLIYDYLCYEGYNSVAHKFAQEARINSNIIPSDERLEIRNLIQTGNIPKAIELINELNPELLDMNSKLHFSLLRLQLIELIRESKSTGDITDALAFATNELSHRTTTELSFLQDFEKAMTLLCFNSNHIEGITNLLDLNVRQDIANQVNLALLKEAGLPTECRLRLLLHLFHWGDESLKKMGIFVPSIAPEL